MSYHVARAAVATDSSPLAAFRPNSYKWKAHVYPVKRNASVHLKKKNVMSPSWYQSLIANR